MDVREEYAQLKPKTLDAVADLLARCGQEYDQWLHDMIRATREKNDGRIDVCVWMAEALAWATFAVRHDDFFANASRFFEDGDPDALSAAAEFPGPYGQDGRLRQAMISFRRLFEARVSQLANPAAEPSRWIRIQEYALRDAQRLKDSDQLGSVGAWLFCAPFKILAVAHPSAWGPRDLDRLIMPTGAQVDRALEMLKKDGVGAPQRLPSSGGGGLAADVADLFATQQFQVQISKCASASVLHINSALYQLGYRGH